MTEKPTAGPWQLFDRPETTAVFGPKEGALYNEVVHWTGFDSSDYQKARVANARLIVSACNAVQSLASHLSVDPVGLARKLEQGGLVELATLVHLMAFPGDFAGRPSADECERRARALLTKIKEDE